MNIDEFGTNLTDTRLKIATEEIHVEQQIISLLLMSS